MTTKPRPDPATLAALLERCRRAPDLHAALDAALAEAVGHKLFTLMTLDTPAQEAARVYSNRPVEYPVKGRKPLGRLTGWGERVLGEGRAYVGRTAEDIRWAFYDHETIAELGCASVLNVPVADGDEILGTVNLLHEEGWYDEADVETVRPFAELLRPDFHSRLAG